MSTKFKPGAEVEILGDIPTKLPLLGYFVCDTSVGGVPYCGVHIPEVSDYKVVPESSVIPGPLRSGSSFSLKHDASKLRFDLIPVGPLQGLAHVYTIGAKKYADRNWEKGLEFSRVYGALLRHLIAWWGGEELDRDDGQHHLDSVAWCAFALREYLDTHPECDDRPGVEARSLIKKMDDFINKEM